MASTTTSEYRPTKSEPTTAAELAGLTSRWESLYLRTDTGMYMVREYRSEKPTVRLVSGQTPGEERPLADGIEWCGPNPTLSPLDLYGLTGPAPRDPKQQDLESLALGEYAQAFHDGDD